jgi:hypothetical protein
VNANQPQRKGKLSHGVKTIKKEQKSHQGVLFTCIYYEEQALTMAAER